MHESDPQPDPNENIDVSAESSIKLIVLLLGLMLLPDRALLWLINRLFPTPKG